MKRLPDIFAVSIAVLAVAISILLAVDIPPAPKQKPAPAPVHAEPDKPAPDCPSWPNRSAASSAASWVNGRAYDGETLTCDFPPSLWFANIGSKVPPHSGMCVTTSVEMIALYLGLDQMRGFRNWCAQEPGGCYPDKLEDQLARFCKAKHVPVPPYVNFADRDPTALLAELDAAGLPYAHSYGQSPRYRSPINPSGRIAHMVFGVKFGGKYGVVVDNNEVGGVDAKSGKIFEWMETGEDVRRMKYGDSVAWVFAFLVPPPPPCPKP